MKPGLSSSAAFRSGSRDHLSYLLFYLINGMCSHFNRLRRGLHKVVSTLLFTVAGARDVQPSNARSARGAAQSSKESSHFVGPSLLHWKTTATHKLSYNGIIGQMFRTDP